MVSEKYTRANGYEADCEVIYGDTDSVMVHFKVPDTARAMELGKDAADYVSATFVKPINLEFEKVHSLGKKKKKKTLPAAVDIHVHHELFASALRGLALENACCTRREEDHALQGTAAFARSKSLIW
jgi:hypothetical protein